ncbi:hypothetical protein SERLA73DRAFT_158302 [Serpula lacrymans var. lacrymans S7.3]|uniref:CUE domain-containing protein n=2 Tax=Serpula lacrymans var. lacrymans TaxID=341189 RepID=F8PKB0_SERL3|nr:uncharacterized protein SERLADRAFT_359631 [Serpula lacrymans var. lacrymans S7.9]EGO03824.1 hypothetical protein SERLA73DRAFT_158302 [Serpula lacrymans var. lacrymans S7.3]EGO29751.1 hypothetical protein SERLADRAFT_359631 [Serpula lacrymans var. lacrymans S7.9]
MTILASLPPYPSTQSRKSLSPSQLATFNQIVSNSLSETIALPPEKRDTPASRSFISSYARDAAQQYLESLIWGKRSSNADIIIRQRVFVLAEKLVLTPPSLDIQTLIDLAIVYAPAHHSRVRALFTTALATSTLLPSAFQSDVVPAFTSFLGPSHSSGLYGLRKTARCLSSLLHTCPPQLLSSFVHNKPFFLALARSYDEGLTALANSYGGTRFASEDRELDDWERIWLETKVDLMDCFHMLITSMLKSLSNASGVVLAAESESIFGILFSLLDTPSPSPVSSFDGSNATVTPFVNRSIVADYQHSYDLARTLSSALQAATHDDARVDLLESTLRSFDIGSSGSERAKDPGALKLLIRSSGIATGVDNLGNRNGRVRQGGSKGKAREIPPVDVSPQDPSLDLKITQVLDIFPDHSPEYIRALLTHTDFSFHASAEKVIEALLEGTAPHEDDLQQIQADQTNIINDGRPMEEWVFTKDRKNIFDDQEMDLTQVHKGKKSLGESTIGQDKAFMEKMKADILRFSEMLSDDDEDVEDQYGEKKRAADDDLDDDFTEKVKIAGDGEDSGDDIEGSDSSATPAHPGPEIILELAYIRNQKLFERDGVTRRSQARAELKSQTGWTDEQIEGWRIMLERNPKKDAILQKHEFAGNRAMPIADYSRGGNVASAARGGRPGRGGSRGRGRGTGGSSGGGADINTRDRAWKDKNKASRGNHNRKRNHDKKMVRAGAGPSV